MANKSFWGMALDEIDDTSTDKKHDASPLSRSIHITKARVTGLHRLVNPEFVDVSVLVTLESQKHPMEVCSIIGRKGFEVQLDLHVKKGERVAFFKKNFSKGLNNPEVQITGYYEEDKVEKVRISKVKGRGDVEDLSAALKSMNAQLGKLKKGIAKLEDDDDGEVKKEASGFWSRSFGRRSIRDKKKE